MDEYSEVDAVDTFELISNPNRISILRSLLESGRGSPMDPWLNYSELHAHSGIQDKGNFNYHLNRLIDSFVIKTEKGYRLSLFGFRVMGLIEAGMYDPDKSVESMMVSGECLYCDAPIEIYYEDSACKLECKDGHVLSEGLTLFPNVIESRTPSKITEITALTSYQSIELTLKEICPLCQGRITGEIRCFEGEEHYRYYGECHQCGNQVGCSVGECAICHPKAAVFFYNQGIDIRMMPFWELPFCRWGAETIVTEDPLRVRIDIAHDGDELSLTFDREASVVETNERVDK